MNHTLPTHTSLLHDTVCVLKKLIAIPSVSREEKLAADFIESYLAERGASPQRLHNNVWAMSTHFSPKRPTLLLNAHIDTVKPSAAWSSSPFSPLQEGDRLYGLGSNDCGGGLCTLMQVFLALREEGELGYNLIYLASAEEEVSGKLGVESVIPHLPPIDVALVGEPTGMQPAIAEKGLMVLDCTSYGKAGHAARNEGVNAIYEALPDIEWFRSAKLPLVSSLLGEVKMSVTMIRAGQQHNVVPDTCEFVVDVRSNECYTNAELLDYIRQQVRCTVKERSTRLNSSHIDVGHPLVQSALALGRKPFGSPTLSDQALMPFPSFKMGPGNSARSHTADEFICISEIEEAISIYMQMLTR